MPGRPASWLTHRYTTVACGKGPKSAKIVALMIVSNVCPSPEIMLWRIGDEESNMECQQVYDDRLEVARRLFRAMCAQYPDRVITLFDPREAQIVARSDQP